MPVRLLVVPGLAVAFALASLKFLPVPYLWALLGAAAGALGVMRSLPSASLRAVAFNFAVAAIAVGVAETYFFLTQSSGATTSYEKGYQVVDPVLGAAPAKNVAARASLSSGDEVVYDVLYTIDSDGLRVSPPAESPVEGSIVFFGCSFTFGEGLADHEAMPYRVGLLTHGKYEVRNFAFHGYGAHQMLAALEAGIVDGVLDSPPVHFVYQALPDHVARAAGIHAYQLNHPRFVLQNGTAVRQGFFVDMQAGETELSELQKTIDYQLGKSYLIRWIRSLERKTTDEDLALWTAIVKQSRQLLLEKYPNATFDVLLWEWVNRPTDREKALAAAMSESLAQAGIRVHIVNNMLPGYEQDPAPYQLSPRYDRHPSAQANDLIARYVVDKIVGASHR